MWEYTPVQWQQTQPIRRGHRHSRLLFSSDTGIFPSMNREFAIVLIKVCLEIPDSLGQILLVALLHCMLGDLDSIS